MTIDQRNEAAITSKEAFQAVGLKWEGTFAEAGAGGIRAIHRKLQERLAEIPHSIHSDTMLGLSYHAVPGSDGFIHYAVVEVEQIDEVPDGMVAVSVPALNYAACSHSKEQSIDQSYNHIYAWIEEQGYSSYHPDHLTHFEKYPMSQDPYAGNPEFIIMIPVQIEAKVPLFIVTGASGVGKTTVMEELRDLMPEFVVVSTDNDNFGTTASKLEYQDRFNLLLHFANAVAKSGRGTIICGTFMPEQAEKCDTYANFSELCFINLHCDDATRNHRLRNREDRAMWTDEMLKTHEEFAKWLLNHAATDFHPPMPIIDTTSTPPSEVAIQIQHYVMRKWKERNVKVRN